ncbi:MAG: GNAT family N-acetyltransferase [Bowdeniella nasicola]|nr:GNAT family N-acetyltransferase [Bowdeniella nasicola]
MRIALLTQWYWPETGPAGLPGTLAAELVRRGDEVHVLTGFPNYPSGRIDPGYRQSLYQREEHDGVIIHRSPLYASHDHSARKRFMNYASFALSATLASMRLPKFDVLWVNYSPITTALPMWALQLRQGVPTVCEVGDLWPDTMFVSQLHGDDTMKRASGFLHRWTNAMYRSSDAVVAIAPSVCDVLVDRGVPRHKVHYIPKWAQEHVFCQPGASMRSSLGIGDEERVIVYAGALGRAQRLGALIDACARLPLHERPRVLIAGMGTDEQNLREMAKSNDVNVDFLGHLPQEYMPDLLASADAGYIGLADEPLTRMTMPSKTQAYLAAGLPIIAHASGDVLSVIANNDVGLVSQSGDVQSLAERLRRFTSMSTCELQRQAENARKLYQQEFSLQRGAERYQELFRRLQGRDRTLISRNAPIRRDAGRVFAPLQLSDVRAAARLHERAFPDFFLASLGEGFLAEFYRGYCADDESIAIGMYDDGELVGTVLVAMQPAGFYRRLLTRRLVPFAFQGGLAALKRPRIALKLLKALMYRGDEQPEYRGAALLASLCVDPKTQGTGGGRQLCEAAEHAVAMRGTSQIYLLTDAEDNDAVLRFYERGGYEHVETITRDDGRKMRRYLKELN